VMVIVGPARAAGARAIIPLSAFTVE